MFKEKNARVLLFTLAIIMAFASLGITASAAGPTPPTDGSGYIIMKVNSQYMNVNGNTVAVDPGRNTVPIVISGRTLIPARALTEAMGGTAGWDQATQKVTLTANGNTVVMTLNKKEFTINGVKSTMDIAPTLLNDRTLIPLRFAGESLGCQVKWFGDTSEILVTFTKGAIQPDYQDKSDLTFADLAKLSFSFLSGVGGWSTDLEIKLDGTFTGFHHDADMGDIGPGYPEGTYYECEFSGKFTSLKKTGAFEYTMKCESLSQVGVPGNTWINQDGQRIIISTPYGFDDANEFKVYLPGKKVSELPEQFIEWVSMPRAIDLSTFATLPFYGLYNVSGELGFSNG